MPRQKSTASQKRGAVTKENSSFVGGWVPKEIVAILDQEVKRTDSDRSKLLRKALRAYLPKPA